MAKDKKEGMGLSKIFSFAVKAGLSIAFGFTVLAAFDFVMFHELAEGQAFIGAVQDDITGLLRADIPIVGASGADAFVSMAEFFGGVSGSAAGFEGLQQATQQATQICVVSYING